MTALAVALQKTSLSKKDLGLELEELEVAARMVVEDEEEQRASKISSSDSSGASSDDSSSSSSSSSSDESEESEADGEGCTDSKDVGEGGGGEMSKDNPPQPQPSSTASLIPQEPTSTRVDTLPSVPVGSRRLIRELGERMAEELKISSDEEQRSRSQPNGAASQTDATPESSGSGTLLEPSPRKNPLLIVQTREDL